MSLNKTYIITQLIHKEEENALEQFFTTLKKERALKLYKALKKATNFLDQKAIIFEATYGSLYAKEKDYLLRNDLRKLSKLLILFIQEKVLKSKDLLQYYQFLLDRKAYHLFDKEIKKSILKLKKSKDESLYGYQKLWLEYVLRYSSRKKEQLEKNNQLLLSIIKETPDNQAYYKSYFIVLFSMFERISWQYFQTSFSVNLDSLINPNLITKDNLVNYHLQKAKSFQLLNESRILQLQKCIDLCQNISHENFNNLEEVNYLESQLGLAYFLQPDYPKSELHFKKAYTNLSALNRSQQIQLVYNYTSMLCANEQFNRVIKIIEQHESIFVDTPYHHIISLFVIMASINLNRTKDLRDKLPAVTDNTTKDGQLYIRIFECIILYYEEEFELCLTNLNNIYNTSRYNKHLDKAFIEFSKLFQKYIAALLILDKQDKQAKLLQSQTQIDKFINAYELGFGSNMLCSIWLKKEIEQALT